jgi:hypothetical protein
MHQSRLSALGVIQMNPEELERVNVEEIIDSFANANKERRDLFYLITFLLKANKS